MKTGSKNCKDRAQLALNIMNMSKTMQRKWRQIDKKGIPGLNLGSSSRV